MKLKIREDDIVLCPYCGHHETHQASPVEFWGEGNSGNGVSIRFMCECCPKEWDLSIQQHKGLTLIESFGVNEENKRRVYKPGELDGKLIKIYRDWGYRKLIYSHYEPNNTQAKTLKKALLDGVDLQCVCFRDKDFSNADLRGLNLNAIDFLRCDMRNVNLLGSSLDGTDFGTSDLTGAKYTQEQMDSAFDQGKSIKLNSEK